MHIVKSSYMLDGMLTGL